MQIQLSPLLSPKSLEDLHSPKLLHCPGFPRKVQCIHLIGSALAICSGLHQQGGWERLGVMQEVPGVSGTQRRDSVAEQPGRMTDARRKQLAKRVPRKRSATELEARTGHIGAVWTKQALGQQRVGCSFERCEGEQGRVQG